jgi:membrane protease YdiL (CAAX protease family)
LQDFLVSIGLKTKNFTLEFTLGLLVSVALIAALIVLLGKPATQPIEHLLQKTSLWSTIFLTFLVIAAQTILLPGMILAAIEQLINTRVALVLSALIFGITFRSTIFGSFADLFFSAGVVLTGLFYGLVFVASRSLWMIFGIRAVLNVFEVSIKDIETTFFESQRILEQSKPPSTSLGIILVSGPSFDGDLQRYTWFVMNLISVILIIFLVLQKRKMVLVKNGRKSS